MASDSMVELQEEALVRNPIEGLREIQKDSVDLLLVPKSSGQVVYGDDGAVNCRSVPESNWLTVSRLWLSR